MARRTWGTPTLIAVAASGAAAGILAAEWGRFVDWTLDLEMNWTDVPGIVVGTSIPLVAGAFFASRLAENDTRRLARAQLSAQREFDDELAATERGERDARRQRWEQIRAITGEFLAVVYRRDPGGPHRERAREEVAGLLAGKPGEVRQGSEFVDRIGGLSDIHVDERAALRRVLPRLVAALTEQLATGHVEDLRNIVMALAGARSIVDVDDVWLPDDYDSLRGFPEVPFRGYGNFIDFGPATTVAIVSELTTSLDYLSTIAHREAAHAADVEFDQMVYERLGTSERPRDALITWRNFYENVARFCEAAGIQPPAEPTP